LFFSRQLAAERRQLPATGRSAATGRPEHCNTTDIAAAESEAIGSNPTEKTGAPRNKPRAPANRS